MIAVYVLVTFYDDAGIHYAGTICKVKAENFDPRFMKKVKSPSEYVYSKTEVDEMLLKKQDDLTAGTNIQISDEDVISATDTGDTVSVTQVQTTGTKIATVTVNAVDTDIYAPEGNPFIIAGAGGIEYIVYGQSFPNQIGFATAVEPSDLDAAIAAKRPVIIKFSDGIIALSNIYKDVDDKIKGSFVAGSNTSDGSTNTARLKILTFQMRTMNDKYVSMYVQDATPSGGGSSVSVTQVQSTGTKIATITVDGSGTDLYAPNGGGGSTDIIADEFDTEPVIVPSVYDKYDIVRVATGSPWNYYWSKNDNNSDEPGQSSKWQSSSAPVTIDTWGTSIPAYGIGKTSGDVYYVNTSASSEWVNPSQGQIPSAVKEAVWKDIWSEGTESYHQYAVGDYCIYEDELYKCNTATTGENWVAASWTQTQVMNEFDTSTVPSISFNTQTDILDVADQSLAVTGTLALGPVDLNLNSKTIRATIIEFSAGSGSMRIVYVSSDVTQLNAVDLQAVATPGGSAWNVTDVYSCQLNHV